MTCALTLIDGEGEHTVTWLSSRPPPALAPVLVALRRAFGTDRRMWP